MNSKKSMLHSILNHLAEEEKLPAQIDLWPSIEHRLSGRKPFSDPREIVMSQNNIVVRRIRFAGAFALVILIAAGVVLATPQGKAWAQEHLRFFTRAGSDTLPVQTFQLTPISETTTPDPGDINKANPNIAEVEQQAGYPVLKPGWVPGNLSIAGATYEPEERITRVFYRDSEGNGLVLKEEPFQQTDDCVLCGKVGTSAAVVEVQIGDSQGEYVEGVWKLTENGPVWESDPYLKTLRWQAEGMAFEIIYMGQPDSVTTADLAAVAESIR